MSFDDAIFQVCFTVVVTVQQLADPDIETVTIACSLIRVKTGRHDGLQVVRTVGADGYGTFLPGNAVIDAVDATAPLIAFVLKIFIEADMK